MREEDRVYDHEAADPITAVRVRRFAAISGDAADHFLKRVSAVRLPEGVPGKPGREDLVAGEIAKTGDGVMRRFEAEEEGLARRNGVETTAAGWLPEIDLAEFGVTCEELVPLEVSVADVA